MDDELKAELIEEYTLALNAEINKRTARNAVLLEADGMFERGINRALRRLNITDNMDAADFLSRKRVKIVIVFEVID